MKCDELKVYVPQDGPYGLEPEEGGKLIEEETCYLKSDVDAAIDELKSANHKERHEYIKMIAELKQKLEDADSIRHHKYKLCLDKAKWCEATALWCYQAACTLPKGFKATLHGKPVMIEPARLFNRQVLLTKWSKRWLELAQKFKDKEAK